MNRRELLATGIGLGSVALTSKASSACGGADKTRDELPAGRYYCPQFPYMFCGSYTLYYSVVYDNTDPTNKMCGANPASLSGPNGLTCGCNAAGCQLTARNKDSLAHKFLEKHGMKKPPKKKVAFAPGAAPIGPNGHLGDLVVFTDDKNMPRDARLFQVDIKATDIDIEMLKELGIDPNLVKDATFLVGHEDPREAGEPAGPKAAGTRLSAHTYSVDATIGGKLGTYFVAMTH